MQKNLKQRKQEGFTIIEVLIVLAIAGLILLVVFMAVPALQRNSRNTQAKNEAAALLGAAAEYSSNNSGKILTASDASSVVALANTTNITGITVEAQKTTQTTPTESTPVLATKAVCSKPSQAAVKDITAAGTNSRQLALVYLTESSTGALYTCTSS